MTTETVLVQGRNKPEVDLYRRLGLSLIPIAVRSKKPIIDWKPYQSRLPTDEEVRGWFERGDNNVGIICGSISQNLYVADLDDPALLNEKVLAEIADKTLVVRTSRGVHVYVRSLVPARITHRATYHLDLIGDGGYVLAPPSTHPSGCKYEFANGVRSIYEVEDINEIVRALDEKFNFHSDGTLLDKPLGEAGIVEGERNNRLFQAAAVDREMGLPIDAVVARARALNASACRPPLPAAEVYGLVKSAYSKPYFENAAQKIVNSIAQATQPLTLEDVHKRFQQWVPAIDSEVLDVVLASACDREIPGDPIWLYLIAAPGCLKTEIVHALRGWKIQFIDKLTRNTLISGYESKTGVKVRGIMPKLDGKVLLIRDFTLLLEMDRRERNEIFAQLRVAYDGELTYGYGVLPEPVTVKASFGLIAAVTPVVDLYTTAQSLLGERFLKIRTKQDRADSVERSRRNQGSETQMRRELNEATLAFLTNVTFDRIPELTDEQNRSIDAIAEFVAFARTVVRYWIPEGGGAPQTDLEPCPEYATRVVKQLVKLLKLVAIIRQHDAITPEDMGTIYRIACDTLIPRRINVLRALYNGGPSDENEIVEWTEMARQPIRTALEELELINLVREDSQGKYALTDQFRQTMETGFGEWFTLREMAYEQPTLVASVGNPITYPSKKDSDLTHVSNQELPPPKAVEPPPEQVAAQIEAMKQLTTHTWQRDHPEAPNT